MKLYTTIKNERGGKKSTADDTRILSELSYGNKVVGELGFYAIKGKDLEGNYVTGYRVLWNGQVVAEEERKEDNCPNYPQDKILPDEDGNCSLCGDDMYHTKTVKR